MAMPQGISVRALFTGLVIGGPLCLTNMYFGLQTSWTMTMAMPAALIGFGIFSAVAKYLSCPFTIEENVFLLTVAGSSASIPLSAGFVGVIPSMQYLTSPEERGSSNFTWTSLLTWSFGICLFGPIFARLLRNFFVVSRPLRFPSGSAVATLLALLFRREDLISEAICYPSNESVTSNRPPERDSPSTADNSRYERGREVRLALVCVAVSGIYTLLSYFTPLMRHLPVFGTVLANQWMWSLNPSPAYIGQGMLMGPTISLHMLLGTIIGWAILSPLASSNGWVSSDIQDWETGSKAWVTWISLAVMLADTCVNVLFTAVLMIKDSKIFSHTGYLKHTSPDPQASPRINSEEENAPLLQNSPSSLHSDNDAAAISTLNAFKKRTKALFAAHWSDSRLWIIFGLLLSIIVCIPATNSSFDYPMPSFELLLVVFVSLILSVMSIKAAGETGEIPVSGIAKIAQAFVGVMPITTKANSVLVNLVTGAISEAGAHSAQDIMHNFKTGHLLRTSPEAQLIGILIGTIFSAFVSSSAYSLYSSYYDIPGDVFEVPTAFAWLQAARLFADDSLSIPEKVPEFAYAAIAIFVSAGIPRSSCANKAWVQWFVPSGIAFLYR